MNRWNSLSLPPFQTWKLYASKIKDAIKEKKHLEWCKAWTSEMIRTLAPGGSFSLTTFLGGT